MLRNNWDSWNNDDFDKEMNKTFKLMITIWIMVLLFGISVTTFLCWVIYRVLIHFNIL